MELLQQLNYDKEKADFLIDGFTNGFDIGYERDEQVRMESDNLKFRVGNPIILWNKVMKKVKLKHFTGPYNKPPFEHFIQSPIGLVPKDGGKETRLIFHLSHPRNQERKSVNANIPAEKCLVKYADFDKAVRRCMEEGINCHISKSDMKSAFRNLGLRKGCWKYLVLKARNPKDNQWYYFVDKCLLFGASISCALFQAFLDSVAYLVQWRSSKKPVNYLNDFLFIALFELMCQNQLNIFIDICTEINFPVALEKTEWPSTRLTFLGLLLDTVNQLVMLPKEKIIKGKGLIQKLLDKKKATIHELQQICGFLNFLGRAIVLGQAFTRRLYGIADDQNGKLKSHHHVRIPQGERQDLAMWLQFLSHPTVLSRLFMDFTTVLTAVEISMFSDAAKNPELGFGAICNEDWMFGQWNSKFILDEDPSIKFLELF